MQITEQSFLFKENLSKNDLQKEVHFIVKRTPFVVKLALSPDTPLSFTKSPLDCVLFYDCAPLKEVEAPNTKPLEWVVRPSSCGRFASVEYRINVLTTQHQNNLFVIRIRLSNPHGPSLEVLSKPIKSVSKPEQVRRRVSQHQAEDPQIDVKASLASCSSKKRARSEELLEALATIQALQAHHSEMLQFLVSSSRPSASSLPSPVPMDLENCLSNMVTSYSDLPLSERPQKLRKLVHKISPQQKSVLMEICSLITSEHSTEDTTQPLWDSLLPFMNPPMVTEYPELDASKCDSLQNSFQQWLQQ